jgi:uncharacterized protein YeaO (DUF488 family)
VIKLKRAYDEPDDRDGKRYLVDRLWPRGITKTSLRIDGWPKEVAPTPALRQWFNHDPQRWAEFQRRYFAELDARPEVWAPLIDGARKGSVTLIYSAHDTEHNNAVALAEYLKRKIKSAP